MADSFPYEPTETRVSVYTNFDFVRQHTTYDEETSICLELKTDIGNLIVYGTIMGILGNRHKSYMTDLSRQIADIGNLAAENKALCVCGDYNCSFEDNSYFTKASRTALEEMLSNNDLALVTRKQPACIDHIAISRGFVGAAAVTVEEWNCDKKLSDHKGICVELLR
jgi:endonuclease/exonuclease/phosphatase family metal-dependent hydrolase